MPVFRYKKMLRKSLSEIKEQGKITGFVPTMGALHRGHLSIVERSVSENDVSVVSIFVNPTQFDNPDDLKKYPRTLEEDIEKLYAIDREIIIFTPSPDDVYDDDVSAGTFYFDGLEHEMEGKYREDHFNGVATVVKKLFEIVMPHKAYFGEKDYQQLLIVKKLTEQTGLPINIIGFPIAREAHGLAMSSRNERLSPAIRKEASYIYEALLNAKELFKTESAATVKQQLAHQFKSTENFSLEYVEIADAETLKPLTTTGKDGKYRIFIAVYAEGVRLIDNIALN